MKIKYNVLWIDDEPEKSAVFAEECRELHGIALHSYKIRKDGIVALQNCFDEWDAVLLDAKMPEESANEIADITGMKDVIDLINKLSIKRKLPYFISTGQPDLMSDDTFRKFFGKYYIKGRDDVQLLNDMVEAMEALPEHQILAMYRDAFDAMDRISLDAQCKKTLIEILASIHFPADHKDFSPKKYYNQIRQVLESLFAVCIEKGILPEACISGGAINLNQSSIYLAGGDCEKIKVRYGEKGDRIVPKYIEKVIQYILHISNSMSHRSSNEDNYEDYFKTSDSRYLIFGYTMHLLEVILWFDGYIRENPDVELNKSKCRLLLQNEKRIHEEVKRPLSLEEANKKYVGQSFLPEKDENGIWHCAECYVRGIKTVDKVEITEVRLNTIAEIKYPYFAVYKRNK